MCSNYQPIKRERADWVRYKFDCDLPNEPWPPEIYPTYASPFIYLHEGEVKCELARFGLTPHWAIGKPRFGTKTYNARAETVHEKPSFRASWKERKFGLILMDQFFEPNWETGKAVRWGIYRADHEPTAAACIWERVIDRSSGEIIMSFSMLTVNADGHEIMKHFHKPEDEKRSVVVLKDDDYLPWLHANHDEARGLLQLAPSGFLRSEPVPKMAIHRAASETLNLLE